ncbi:hypothetical protein [Aeromonas salmonicida]
MIHREGNKQSASFTIEGIYLQTDGQTAVDLSEILVSLKINESLDGLMNGEIAITEKLGLFDQRSFGGKDNVLVIKMRSTAKHKADGKLFEKRFKVYQYSNAYSHESAHGNAILMFKSEGDYDNNFHRVSKSYANTGTHVIVKDMLGILGYEDKELNVESTMFNRDIVIPNIRPLEVIEYLKSHSVSGESKNKGDSAFYFFENRDKINFISRSAIMSKEPVATYNVCLDKDNMEQNTAINFVLDRGMNTLMQVRDGAYGMTIVSHSLVDKSIKHVAVTPDAVEQSFKPLNVRKTTNVDYDPSNRIVMVSEDQMYQFQNVNPNGNSIAIRDISRSRLNERIAQMRIGADSDITVGDQINLYVDGANGQSDSSGRWLVRDIVHLINKESWYMDLKLVSDGTSDTLAKPKEDKQGK